MARQRSAKAAMAQMDKVAEAIGWVCIFWAWLEHTIDEAIYTIIAFDTLKIGEKRIKEIENAFAASGDIRSKIKTLRAVAFICKWDDRWFKKMDKLLNRIDNELRPRRNMYVHHHWTAPKGRLEIFSKQAKFKRPQSFKLELITSERKPIKMGEVRRLYSAILSSQIKLIGLYLEHKEIQKYVEDEAAKQHNQAIADMVIKQLLQPDSSPAKSDQPPPPAARSKRLPTKRRSRS
jgi:hypothetical protein